MAHVHARGLWVSIVEGEVLGTRFIEELLSLVDATPDPTAQLQAERDQLTREIDNLVKSVAKGCRRRDRTRSSRASAGGRSD
jgi:hypothetical protein